jgi:quercetin dioxygenase-like cupin family protein
MTQLTVTNLREKDLPTNRWVDDVSTMQIVTPKRGAKSILNGFASIPPGSAIPLHYHNCEESVVIVQGKSTVEVDGKQFVASLGDVTRLLANAPHRFTNSFNPERL